jgi:hypothetical protein
MGKIMNSLEGVWEHREEVLFPSMFGEKSEGIFTLSANIFTDIFQQESYDPRWLFLGVMEFRPSPRRDSWLYVTSGGTTPWETDPDQYNSAEPSWLGTELVIESPEKAEWPVLVLQRLLAYNVLLCHGMYGDARSLDYGARIPLGGPIAPKSDLRFVALAKPAHYPHTAQLPSGTIDFLHVVGITEAERDYAKEHSTQAMIDLLQSAGAFPITDPARNSPV